MTKTGWIVAGLALGVGVLLAVLVGPTADFYRTLVATYIGAALGFLVALFIDRLQRVEADAARRKTEQAEDARIRAREAEVARDRRVAVLTLLRKELGAVPNQMGKRQVRNYAPFDRLTDILWRSFSASGELRWVDDLGLLNQISSAYDLLAVEIDLERQWMQARAVAGGGKVVSEDGIANQLKVYDHDLWRLACQACKAMDAALIADGAAPGGEMFCP
jgi:hypothetical protein